MGERNAHFLPSLNLHGDATSGLLPTHTAPQPTCGPLGRAPIVQLHSGDEGAERALREGRDDQAWRVAKVLQAVVQVAVAAADNDLQEQEQDKGGRRCVTSLRESCC